MNKYENPLLWFLLIIVMTIFGIVLGHMSAYDEIEKRCMYDNRIMFGKQMYSCQWLEGVTIDNQQYERKPHPLAKQLK